MKKLFILIILIGTLFVSSGQTYEQQSLIPTLQEWLPDKPLETTLSKLEVPYWGTTISVEERGYYHFVEFLLKEERPLFHLWLHRCCHLFDFAEAWIPSAKCRYLDVTRRNR